MYQDIQGNEIKVDDIVAFGTADGNTPRLRVRKVCGVGPEGVRVCDVEFKAGAYPRGRIGKHSNMLVIA